MDSSSGGRLHTDMITFPFIKGAAACGHSYLTAFYPRPKRVSHNAMCRVWLAGGPNNNFAY